MEKFEALKITKVEKEMLISSIKYSIEAVNKKLEKYDSYTLRSDMDEREQGNFDTLRGTRKKYRDMAETLGNYETN